MNELPFNLIFFINLTMSQMQETNWWGQRVKRRAHKSFVWKRQNSLELSGAAWIQTMQTFLFEQSFPFPDIKNYQSFF